MLRMPIMDGRTSAAEIRKMEENLILRDDIDPVRVDGRIPIFAVSASLYESDRSNLSEHFDGWLLKPLGEPINILVEHRANITRLYSSPRAHQGVARQREEGGGGVRSRSMGEGRVLQR